MNQSKLEAVTQEMARVNTDILGISELKWTGMGEFNSDDHYIYYRGQESLKKNGVALIVTKEFKMQYLGQWEIVAAVLSPVPAPQNRTSLRYGEWGSPGGGVGAQCGVPRGVGIPVRVQPRPRLRANWFLVAGLGESSSPG